MSSDLSLRELKITDQKYFAKWWRDRDLIKFTSGRPKLISDKKVDKYFSMMRDKNDYHFMILLSQEVIGHVALMKKRNKWYETIIIIGEKEYWNKGYGTKAIQMIIKKAKCLGISKIYLEVRPNNLRAIRAYEKCGFKKVGVRKYPKNKYLPITLRMELKENRVYPKLRFIINKNKEMETFLNFYNWAKHQKNDRDLNWAIYKPHLKLNVIKDKGLVEQKTEIRRYINNFYKQNINKIRKGTLNTRKEWQSVEKEFFILVDEIFKGFPWLRGKYIAYSTIWGMFPRYLHNKTFLFPYSHRKKNYALIVVAHEMLHFMFYDYVYTKFPEYRKNKYSSDLWDASEIFNVIIQNSPEWVRVFRQNLVSYPEHKKHIPKLKKYWEEPKNIDVWVEKSIKYFKKQYKNRMFKFGQRPNKKVESLVSLLPKGGKVLDLGCGAGGNSIFLGEKGFNVTCIDADKEVINGIKKNYPKVNAVNKNILEFDFPENKYDLILALNVLHFLNFEDIKKIVSKMLKSLKKDGLIYAQVFSVNNPTKKFLHLFTKEEISELFSQNNVLELEELSIKDNHPPQGEHEHSIIRMLIKNST